MITAAIAPASAAFPIFSANEHEPRWISAIFPAIAAALASGPQPSAGSVVRSSPEMGPTVKRRGVNWASDEGYVATAEGGDVTESVRRSLSWLAATLRTSGYDAGAPVAKKFCPSLPAAATISVPMF